MQYSFWTVMIRTLRMYMQYVQYSEQKPTKIFFHARSTKCLDTNILILHLIQLTNWGRVTHICVRKLTIIGSDNGLSPSRRQAIIWTNAGILLIRPRGINFSEILIEIDVFSFKKMHVKMSSAQCRPFCLGLNVLNLVFPITAQNDCLLMSPMSQHSKSLVTKEK